MPIQPLFRFKINNKYLINPLCLQKNKTKENYLNKR